MVQAGWENDNRGKRGVALDLDQPGGREILLRLCETADVLITNFTAQRAERYDLTFEAVHARAPRLVHTTLSGYGTRGPDANRLATDYLAFWARGGIQSMIGDRPAPPILPMSGQGDHTTTLGILATVLAALPPGGVLAPAALGGLTATVGVTAGFSQRIVTAADLATGPVEFTRGVTRAVYTSVRSTRIGPSERVTLVAGSLAEGPTSFFCSSQKETL